MSKPGYFWRGLLLGLPITLLSVLAVWTVWAATTSATVPTGPISTTVNPNFTMSNYAAYPAGINGLSVPDVPPIIMLVMSRDEQLFNKAYSDYTDLNNDGTLDTTYLDSFTYNGYFDPSVCYSYGTMPAGGSGFYAAAKVSVAVHECPSGNSYWSGNFLNWLSMSRLDIVRWTLYGGMRQIDTSSATVLERAEIPVDLHSWAKVYSGSDIANLAPFSGTTTFCNTSGGVTGSGSSAVGNPAATSMNAASSTSGNISVTGKWKAATTALSGVQSTPFIRTASGAWNDWASNAKVQCFNTFSGDSSAMAKPTGTPKDYVARVQVCQNVSGTPTESFCVAEANGVYKPEGLLQKYSKGDSYEKHFGLVTASTANARGAGQLRRNVGMLAGNGGNTNTCQIDSAGAGGDDEFDSNTGQFCYKEQASAPSEGIVYSIDRFQIVGYQYEASGDNSGAYDYGDSPSTTGCYGPNKPWGARGYQLLATTTMCPDFGNPIAAVYATALQYLQGQTITPVTDSLPTPTWFDPYGTPTGSSTQRNAECAACSIVVLSSGLNTFDAPNTQTLPTVSNLSSNLSSLMSSIQQGEALSGNYLLSTYAGATTSSITAGSLTIGNATTSDVTACASAALSTLNSLVGICNGAPGQQGGYLFAGLSLGAWNASGILPIRTDGHVPGNFQIKTFAVALSDNLPSFTIPVGTSGSISLSPSCRADPESSGNYTTCFTGSVQIGAQYIYNLSTTATGFNTYGLVPTTTYPNVGSYYFVWEDSQYGSDHDQDANNVISYCVGASCKMPSTVNKTSGAVAICDPVVFNGKVSTKTTAANSNMIFGNVCNANGTLAVTVNSTDILIRNQIVAYSSQGMYVGYATSGTTSDNRYETFVSYGGAATSTTQNGAIFNCNLLGGTAGGDCDSAPVVQKFTLGSTAPVQSLQTPLWYGAKYSGFTGTQPTLATGTDPSNYFFARNAGQLKSQLDSVFQSITSVAANNFGNATTPSSSNDVQGNGLAYQVQYYMQRSGINWTGDLLALWMDSSGYEREGMLSSTGNEELDASAFYVVNGADTAQGALPGQMALYRCSVAPVSTPTTPFNPASNSACSMVGPSNQLKPAWDAGTLLNAYYDPTTTAGLSAINNIPVQRTYSADAGSGTAYGQRYIFTYLPNPTGTWTPNGGTATGTITNGIQTDFVWNASSCSSAGVYTSGAQAGFCGTYNTSTSKRTGNYSLLNEQSPTLAQELVNWVRGAESADYRSRTTVSSSGSYTYRLGDIIDSSPMIVGTPAEAYDTLYSSASYGAFRFNYLSRRQMIYVGGNDGMVHAFNGGFYVAGQTVASLSSSSSSSSSDPTVYRQLPAGVSLSTGDAKVKLGNNWSLGQEVWAFIPGNLLPHLRWMADKNYSHVFYVDGSPLASDVQLWGTGSSTTCQSGQPAAADIDTQGHVCGWGTVLVVPFRLGGGFIQIDTVGSDSNASANLQNSNPAYVILDVTDPEQPPTVLGEITTASYNSTSSTYTSGTYTTSAPAIVAHREQDGNLHFLLAIGSGPGDNGGPIPSTNSTGIPNNVLWCGTSQTAGNKVVQAPCNSNLTAWVYDLATIKAGGSTAAATLTTGPANSFAGDMIGSDFNLNFSAEAIYFGVVTNPTTSTVSGTYTDTAPFGGGLYKIDMNTGPATISGQPNAPDESDPSTWKLKSIINTGQPVTIRPTVGLDNTGRPMIYFGTGRAYTQDDDSGSSLQGTQQQYIYGVADLSLLTGLASTCQTLPVATTSLFNASTTTLSTTGTISVGKNSGLSNASSVTSLNGLVGSLTSTDTTSTDANFGCYLYNGWMYALTPGVMPTSTNGIPANKAQPSERVVSSQVLFNQILLTPTYIPPGAAAIAAANQSVCNPVPVPGTSNLYGMNYLTGTANIGMINTFGSANGLVKSVVSLGSGLASAPVLHAGNGMITAAVGLSGGTTIQAVSLLNPVNNNEISWREPATNQ